LKVNYTEEAVADIIDAIAYLAECSPSAAIDLDNRISHCIMRLAADEFDGPVTETPLRCRGAKLECSTVSSLLSALNGGAVDRSRLPPGEKASRLK
jgi:plasmid stabilization system protein ParE